MFKAPKSKLVPATEKPIDMLSPAALSATCFKFFIALTILWGHRYLSFPLIFIARNMNELNLANDPL